MVGFYLDGFRRIASIDSVQIIAGSLSLGGCEK